MVGDGAEDGELADELEAVARVYRGPLEEFVARRDALVAELRAAGRRDDANRVKRWRKPTRVAWALDAAVLQGRSNAESLAASVATMVAAQSGRGDVRAAAEGLRLAVRDLASAAAEVAAEGGHPVDRAGLVPAVMAVVADPEALAALRAGCLTDIPPPRELGLLSQAPPGVEPAAADATTLTSGGAATAAGTRGAEGTETRAPRAEGVAPGAPTAEGVAPGGPDAAAVEAAREAVERAEAEVAAARERADAADGAVSDREAALDAANDRLRRAEQEIRAARNQLREAQQAAKVTRQQVRQAERDAAAARAALDAVTR